MSDTVESTPEKTQTHYPPSGLRPGMVPWKPGQSGNPGGRPKGIAAIVRELTNDGRSLLEMVWQIASDETVAKRERLEASKILLDRGFGRAPEISLVASVDAGQVDLSALANDQLEHLVRHIASPGPRHVLSAHAVDDAVDALIDEPNPLDSQASRAPDGVSEDYTIKGNRGDAPSQDVGTGGGEGGSQPPVRSPVARAGDPANNFPQKTLDTKGPNKNSAPKTPAKKRKKASPPKAKPIKVSIKLKSPAANAVDSGDK